MKVLIEGTTPCAELNIKNSRFIAEAFTVHDSLEAREKLHEQKKRYSDARTTTIPIRNTASGSSLRKRWRNKRHERRR